MGIVCVGLGIAGGGLGVSLGVAGIGTVGGGWVVVIKSDNFREVFSSQMVWHGNSGGCGSGCPSVWV